MAKIKLEFDAKPFTGQIVTFVAPCSCEEVTDGLVINGNTYTIVDAMGAAIKAGAWCSGALVAVALDTANKKAYIQNRAVTPASIGAAPTSHNHSATEITSGTLAVARGGTGSGTAISGAGAGAVFRKASDGDYMWYTNTANGAFYATAANTLPKFGTLPVAQGGTGATTAADALTALGAAASSHNHSASNITSGTLGVARGGTGATTFTSGAALIGAGTGAVTTRAITNLTAKGAVTGSTNLATANTVLYHAQNRLNRTTAVNAADTAYTTYMARGIAAGTTALTAGTSELTSGCIYLQYE